MAAPGSNQLRSDAQNPTHNMPALRSQAEFFMTGVVPVGAQPSQDCSICTEPLDEDVVQMVPCTHSFHCLCILTWLQGFDHQNRTCPNCRCEFYEASPEAIIQASSSDSASDTSSDAGPDAGTVNDNMMDILNSLRTEIENCYNGVSTLHYDHFIQFETCLQHLRYRLHEDYNVPLRIRSEMMDLSALMWCSSFYDALQSNNFPGEDPGPAYASNGPQLED
ncbi:Nn.00g002480.m01.CDS01 [Neocucurbitaria sp. VM-36]